MFFLKKILLLFFFSLFLTLISFFVYPKIFIFFPLSDNINKKIGEYLFLSRFDYDNAILFLEKAKKQNPDSQTNLFLLGRVYFVKNELTKSIENYTKSIESHKNEEDLNIYMQSFYGRGLAYGFYSPVFLKEAEDDFKTYIEIEEKNFVNTGERAYGAWAGYNDLAWVYFLQNDLDSVEKVANKGLVISPNNPWLLNILGASLMGQKRYSEAETILEKALFYMKEISPNEWGEAYSGDNSKLYKKGRDEMLKTIRENIWNIKSITQKEAK